jgi:hypothetical protein
LELNVTTANFSLKTAGVGASYALKIFSRLFWFFLLNSNLKVHVLSIINIICYLSCSRLYFLKISFIWITSYLKCVMALDVDLTNIFTTVFGKFWCQNWILMIWYNVSCFISIHEMTVIQLLESCCPGDMLCWGDHRCT